MKSSSTSSSSSFLFTVHPKVSFIRVNIRATRLFSKSAAMMDRVFFRNRSLEPHGPHKSVQGLTSADVLKFVFTSRKKNLPCILEIKDSGYCCNWNLCRGYQNYVKGIHTSIQTRATALPKATPEALASCFKSSSILSVVVPWAISCKLNFLH